MKLCATAVVVLALSALAHLPTSVLRSATPRWSAVREVALWCEVVAIKHLESGEYEVWWVNGSSTLRIRVKLPSEVGGWSHYFTGVRVELSDEEFSPRDLASVPKRCMLVGFSSRELLFEAFSLRDIELKLTRRYRSLRTRVWVAYASEVLARGELRPLSDRLFIIKVGVPRPAPPIGRLSYTTVDLGRYGVARGILSVEGVAGTFDVYVTLDGTALKAYSERDFTVEVLLEGGGTSAMRPEPRVRAYRVLSRFSEGGSAEVCGSGGAREVLVRLSVEDVPDYSVHSTVCELEVNEGARLVGAPQGVLGLGYRSYDRTYEVTVPGSVRAFRLRFANLTKVAFKRMLVVYLREVSAAASFQALSDELALVRIALRTAPRGHFVVSFPSSGGIAGIRSLSLEPVASGAYHAVGGICWLLTRYSLSVQFFYAKLVTVEVGLKLPPPAIIEERVPQSFRVRRSV